MVHFTKHTSACENGNAWSGGGEAKVSNGAVRSNRQSPNMIMELGSGGGGRTNTIPSTTAAQQSSIDINYNSPGHHSSQDGSFIQDETEMHLILDFERENETAGLLPSFATNRQHNWDDFYRPTLSRPFQPSSVLTASWIRKQRSNWATDFDANIAELDFDNDTTQEILELPQNVFNLPPLPPPAPPIQPTKDDQQRFWASIGEECLDEVEMDFGPPTGGSSLPTLPMKGSLELSSGESLFSSAADPAIETEEALKIVANGVGGGISTDSLDLSAFDPEQLLVACETKKQDYMLTFQQMSVMGASSIVKNEPVVDEMNLYKDAKLSRAGEQLTEVERKPNNAENLTESEKLTTWGRIKRSYDNSGFDDGSNGSAKFYSSPDLMGCQSPGIPDAGEGMANKDLLPIYDLTVSQHYQSAEERSPMGAEPISLLRVFRNKLSINNDSCGMSSLDEDTSSGYVTGEKSDNATAVERLVDEVRHAGTTDYEYAEYYIGNGRYIDVNQNEIGFVPPSTEGIQSTRRAVAQSPSEQTPTSSPQRQAATVQDRWATLTPRLSIMPPAKPPRTFAALLAGADNEVAELAAKVAHLATQVPVYVSDQGSQTTNDDSGRLITTVVTSANLQRNADKLVYARSNGSVPTVPLLTKATDDEDRPDLSFLKMPFQIPPLFPACAPFPLEFLSNEKNAPTMQNELQPPSTSGNMSTEAKTIGKTVSVPIFANQALPSFPGQMFGGFDKSRGLSVEALSGHLELFPPFSSNLHEVATVANFSPQQHPPPPPVNRSAPGTSNNGESAVGRERDSGLGSSGPSNVHDWESLAMLLPKEVAHACSFFKANSHFLGKSTQIGGNCSPREMFADGNCIDKPASRKYCRLRPQSYDASIGRYYRWNRIESIREEDASPHCHHARCYSCHDGGSSGDTPRFRHRRGASSVQFRPHHAHMCHPPVVVHCCGGTATPRYCTSASTPCHPTWSPCCSTTGCSSSRLESQPSCNLKRWRCRAATDSESELTDQERPSSTAVQKRARTSSIRPIRLTSSISSCSEEEHIEEEEPLMMASEYQLRERDGRVDSKQFRSMQNFRGNADCQTETRPCATCYKVRSPTSSGAPPIWAQPPAVKQMLCDCRTADVLDELNCERRRWRKVKPGEIHPEEVAVRRTTIYLEKKGLVDEVIVCCDSLTSVFHDRSSPEKHGEEVRLRVRNSLCPAVEALVADGLLDRTKLWTVVKSAVTLGPATKPIYDLVTELSAVSGMTNDGEQDTPRFYAFIQALLEKRLLDCWLSYMVLKDTLLEANYEEAAFLRRSVTAYKLQFDRLIGAIQPLSLLPFDQLLLSFPVSSTSTPENEGGSDRPAFKLLPTRLPSDSRVPKSSSIPSRLFSPERPPKTSQSLDTGLSVAAAVSKLTTKATTVSTSTTPVVVNKAAPRPMSRSRIPVLKTSTASSTMSAGTTPSAATTPTSTLTKVIDDDIIRKPAVNTRRSETEQKSKIARPMSRGRKP